MHFLQEANRTEFLFKRDVNELIDSLYTNSVEVESLETSISQARGDAFQGQRTALAQKQSELIKWFTQQHKIARALFGQYLEIHES